jgi:putative endonuclease
LTSNRTYVVYILSSLSRILYIGVTNDLERRLTEHRVGLVPGFTSQYRILRLVHFECFGDIRDAIAREKELKGWRRSKKVALIELKNGTWADLAASLCPVRKQEQIPRPPRRTRDDSKPAGARGSD